MKKILCVIREPFIDRIPSLKSLLVLLSESEKTVEILTTTDDAYVKPTFLNDNLLLKEVSQRKEGRGFQLPTTINLLLVTFKLLFLENYSAVIGAGRYGMIASYYTSKLFGKKFIAFCIEFPQIITETHTKLTLGEKLENHFIKNADYVITHDEFHLNFLVDHLNVEKSKILTLPNGTIGEAKHIQSTFLQKRLKLSDDDILILHSGGVGPWFLCKELASSTDKWPDNWKLVFHASHNIKNDFYAQEIMAEANKKNILFSLEPVKTDELDILVASANIGIALYSLKELGYRAEFMGLASGKIGNYLKCGVPVITSNINSLKYIENYNCGVCVESATDIQEAIEKISINYDAFSENAIRCYNDLWKPNKSFQTILEKISL
jgi:glycosyltransferase involved in cell wall biosynthesis